MAHTEESPHHNIGPPENPIWVYESDFVVLCGALRLLGEGDEFPVFRDVLWDAIGGTEGAAGWVDVIPAIAGSPAHGR